MLSMRLARPTQLVDVNGVAALAGIDGPTAITSRIGATTPRAGRRAVGARGRSASRCWPRRSRYIGHVSIRNRGTVGGSIAHADAVGRAACGRRRSPTPRWSCGARAASGSIARRRLLRRRTSPPPRRRRVPRRGPDPDRPAGRGWAFQEVARRHGDFALVGVAAMVALDGDGAIGEARVCLFGVADRPVRAPRRRGVARRAQAPTATRSRRPPPTRSATSSPASDMHGSADYRRHLAGVTVRRALDHRRRASRSSSHDQEIRLVVERRASAPADADVRDDARRLPARPASSSPAPTSAASTACAARAPSSSTACACGRASCSPCRRRATR